MATQFGISCNADFEENQWGFNMPENFKVRAGAFAIVDKPVYNEMLKCLNELAENNLMTPDLTERCRQVLVKNIIDEK